MESDWPVPTPPMTVETRRTTSSAVTLHVDVRAVVGPFVALMPRWFGLVRVMVGSLKGAKQADIATGRETGRTGDGRTERSTR